MYIVMVGNLTTLVQIFYKRTHFKQRNFIIGNIIIYNN